MQYSDIASAYDTLSDVCRRAGPLDAESVALAKLAVSVGGRIERTVHIHAKKALRTGVNPQALRQIAMIALPTIGLPAALDALRWIDESICETLPGTDGCDRARRSRVATSVRRADGAHAQAHSPGRRTKPGAHARS